MRSILTICIVLAFCLTNGIVSAQNSSADYLAVTKSVAEVTLFEGSTSNNKVLLNWTASNNGSANMFQVEKSIDGRNFAMTAVVFCSEEKDNAAYQFYEKAADKKMFYRIRIIHKNNSVSYSEILTISKDKPSPNRKK